MHLLRLLIIILPVAGCSCAGCGTHDPAGPSSNPNTHPTSSTAFTPTPDLPPHGM